MPSLCPPLKENIGVTWSCYPQHSRGQSFSGTVLEGVGGEYPQGRTLMMEAGRVWWVNLLKENCNHARAGRVRMNWGHWRPRAIIGMPLVWGVGGRGLISGWGGGIREQY